MQILLKLIIASALAFAFVGSPIAQAQDRPLAQTLEALALELEQWQEAQAQASAKIIKAQERMLKHIETVENERAAKVADVEEDEQKAREQMAEEEFTKCQAWRAAATVVSDAKGYLWSMRVDKRNHLDDMQEYVEDAEEQLNALTQALNDVLTQLAAALDQNE